MSDADGGALRRSFQSDFSIHEFRARRAKVMGIESLAQNLENAESLYVPWRQAEGSAMSWDTLQRAQAGHESCEANAWYGHYSANNCSLHDGDLVFVDGVPDYRYYTSDIGRMWPVNCTFSPVQRELYGFVVRYHQVFLSLIRPGVADEQIRLEAREQMSGVVEKTRFGLY